MNVRRRPAVLAVVALALVAVACGDDESADPAPTATLPDVADTTVPGGGTPADPSGTYVYPTGADEKKSQLITACNQTWGHRLGRAARQDLGHCLPISKGRTFTIACVSE